MYEVHGVSLHALQSIPSVVLKHMDKVTHIIIGVRKIFLAYGRGIYRSGEKAA
jgi:hypothetical protein